VREPTDNVGFAVLDCPVDRAPEWIDYEGWSVALSTAYKRKYAGKHSHDPSKPKTLASNFLSSHFNGQKSHSFAESIEWPNNPIW
jgi:hypothetical protein